MDRTEPLLLAATTAWIEIAMIIFMVVFVGIVVWVLLVRPGGFKNEARIPLEEDRVLTPRTTAPTGSPHAASSDDKETSP
jgi:hypothetical protein